jgi:hypothetical protein
VAREKASQVLRDAVAILLESETGTKLGTDTRRKTHDQSTSSLAPALPLPNWDDHRHTVEATPVRSLAADQSSSPLPIAYATTTTRKRSHEFGFQESAASSRRRTAQGSLLYFEDMHQNDPRAPNPLRRRSSDAVMVRHHSSMSMSSSARYSSHPHQSDSSFHGPRLQLHRRRSSATDVSSTVLLGDANQVYSEFDLFNGQLLDSDGEERAGA